MLVGFADAIAAPEAAWSLADAGFLVSTFSRAGRRVALTRSSAVEQKLDVTPPERDAEATVRDLQRIAGTGAFDAVLPLDDQAIWTCARAFAGSTVTVVGPSGALADLALDKREQLEIAEAAGFQCFPTTVVTEPADAATHPPFPVVVKPALAAELHGKRLSRGKMSVCANESELAAALAQRSGVAPDLLQPYRSGHGEGLFGLATAHG
ncbi:MAG TPA: hypothetical protein VN636_06955, partial [Acidimicrobiia bacterium]|nr:hypothetical protein [Acidimicrobiia bacterium]